MPPSNAPLLSTMEAHTRQHPRCATRSDLCQSTSMIGAIPHGHHDRPYACHTAPARGPQTYSVPERWFSRARPCALRGALGCWAPPLVLYPNAWPLSLTPYLPPHSLHSPYPPRSPFASLALLPPSLPPSSLHPPPALAIPHPPIRLSRPQVREDTVRHMGGAEGEGRHGAALHTDPGVCGEDVRPWNRGEGTKQYTRIST